MSVKKIVALSFIFSGFGILIGFFVLRYLQAHQPSAGLKVDTTPPSLVFVDGIEIGRTPIDKHFPPGEVNLKLVPTTSLSALSTYQAKIRLTNKVYTIVKRDFGIDETSSSGETVSLQSQTDSAPSLNVLSSSPDSASVSVDNQPQGYTPLSVTSVSPGTHLIQISSPGYQTRQITAQAISGFKLIVNVKLSLLPTPTPAPQIVLSPTPSSSASLSKPYVTIKNTPVGFLRVRSGPSSTSSEVGQVKPGEKYPLLDSQSGWYKIPVDFTATSSGWISSQYAQKSE